MVELANDEVIDLKETFRGKPSDALEYMCDGLLKQDKRKDFEIAMSTFGDTDGEVCFGCGATSAIQEIAGRNLTAENICDRELIGFDPIEMFKFEVVINDARLGWLYSLFAFCEVIEVDCQKWMCLWRMDSENWKSCIPTIRKAIREMRAVGI